MSVITDVENELVKLWDSLKAHVAPSVEADAVALFNDGKAQVSQIVHTALTDVQADATKAEGDVAQVAGEAANATVPSQPTA